MIAFQSLGQGLGIDPFSSRERPFRIRISLGESVDIRPCRRILTQRGTAEKFFGGDAGKVHRGIGVDKVCRVSRLVGNKLTIAGERLSKAPVLKREVGEKFECLISPGATKRLIDDATEGGTIPPRHTLSIPTLSLRVDTRAIDFTSFRRQGRDLPLAKLTEIDVKYGVSRWIAGGVIFRQFRDFIAKLLNHSLIDINRLGPLLVTYKPCRIAQLSVGGVAEIGIKLRGRPGVILRSCDANETNQHDESGKNERMPGKWAELSLVKAMEPA